MSEDCDAEMLCIMIRIRLLSPAGAHWWHGGLSANIGRGEDRDETERPRVLAQNARRPRQERAEELKA